jgi:chromosome segregation ATPase
MQLQHAVTQLRAHAARLEAQQQELASQDAADEAQGESLRAQVAALYARHSTALAAVALFTSDDPDFAATQATEAAALEAEHARVTSALAALADNATARQVAREQITAELQRIVAEHHDLIQKRTHAQKTYERLHEQEGERAYTELMEPLVAVRQRLADARKIVADIKHEEEAERDRVRRAARTQLAQWPDLHQRVEEETQEEQTRLDAAAERNVDAMLSPEQRRAWNKGTTPPATPQPVPYADDEMVRELLARRRSRGLAGNVFAGQVTQMDEYERVILPRLRREAQERAIAEAKMQRAEEHDAQQQD